MLLPHTFLDVFKRFGLVVFGICDNPGKFLGRKDQVFVLDIR